MPIQRNEYSEFQRMVCKHCKESQWVSKRHYPSGVWSHPDREPWDCTVCGQENKSDRRFWGEFGDAYTLVQLLERFPEVESLISKDDNIIHFKHFDETDEEWDVRLQEHQARIEAKQALEAQLEPVNEKLFGYNDKRPRFTGVVSSFGSRSGYGGIPESTIVISDIWLADLEVPKFEYIFQFEFGFGTQFRNLDLSVGDRIEFNAKFNGELTVNSSGELSAQMRSTGTGDLLKRPTKIVKL